ncbi:efflux RND transporter periplasmic adaptor subunit [Halieaceae bacterium IMCC14734]|uniref:Efflux RND transporter periplasmic adaptor subunit n=1 Tax=Candidatus Litorirhabdus singularis TaxID=2518993 RepID=A0ABT3TJG8_9GAMM|nr:efflux RND transporter periplasmic adaptor subunit [Candidatus Litorirhabdus singularis]MCX2981554.1 efflux RND transporter periplasmic adaptor subunit [Candidatus Litorirhabdus singularis]
MSFPLLSFSKSSLLILLLLLVACGSAEPPVSGPGQTLTVAVVVHQLSPQSWQGKVSSFGVVEALEQVDVSSETHGTVAAVMVKEGDAVEAGDLLVELDRNKAELRLTQASRGAEQAHALLEEARLRLQRREDLARQDTISAETLDNARLAVLAVEANYRRAQAVRQLAQRELKDTRIVSPARGLVDQKLVEPGEPVTIGATLVRLQVVQVMRVHTWISESDISHLHAGAVASVTLTGIKGVHYAARVEWVGVKADPATGNFPVKLILEAGDPRIRPGMTATASIELLEQPEVLLLPEAALVDRDRQRVVFVVREGRVQQVKPLLAAGYGSRLQVLAGLVAGDQVVVDGHFGLNDGTPVSVTESF